MVKILALTLLFVSLAGCGYHTQTSSGKAFLAKYQNVPVTSSVAAGDVGIEEQIRQVASVEPILQFPARIGLARVDHGQLSAIPGEEMASWIEVRDKLGSNFGEFVPVSPLVANLVSNSNGRRVTDVMHKIRLGAARQHLDAVLIYEVYSKFDSESNILSIANLTIIGGFILPSQSVEAEGFANAMLIDVIQGYPYGMIETVVDKEATYSTAWGSGNKGGELVDKVKTQAGKQIADESYEMFLRLRAELAEKKLNKSS